MVWQHTAMRLAVTVPDGVAAQVPGLAAAVAAVRRAETEEERAAVYRLRYSVYVEELARTVGGIRDDDRRLADPADDDASTTLLYTAAADGPMTGTARVRGYRAGSVPEELRTRFGLTELSGVDQGGVAELGRVMVHRQHRGGPGFEALLGAAYLLAATELNVEVMFLTCLTGLVERYRRAGFRAYGAPLVPTADGVTVPLMLVLPDRAALEEVGSCLAPFAAAVYAQGRDSAGILGHLPMPDRADAIGSDADLVRARLDRSRQGNPNGSGFLRGLAPATVQLLLDHGLVIDVRAGQLLTRKRLVQRELFVIIEGVFEIHDGSRRLRSVGPEEVIGEVGFFATDRRRSASVTAATDGRVLVIRRGWLDDLRTSDPSSAADILFGLARTLADRVSTEPPG
jgi:predicted GNAT family N-acyltransferase